MVRRRALLNRSAENSRPIPKWLNLFSSAGSNQRGVRNIILKKHVFQGLAASDAQSIVDDFRALPFTFVPTATLLDDAYKLAVKHKRTVYDSLYLALSLREGCQFVTADEKFVNAIGSSFPGIVGIANWT